jgi:dUTP pyrophosphatase
MDVHIDGLSPKKAHTDDAAFDLFANQAMMIPQGEGRAVDCGFAIAIPQGFVGLVCSRSGLALKHGVFVLNAPGVIDPGYRGNVSVILFNVGPTNFHIAPCDRIAQLLIVPVADAVLAQNKNALAAPTERGDGGFGSTGF